MLWPKKETGTSRNGSRAAVTASASGAMVSMHGSEDTAAGRTQVASWFTHPTEPANMWGGCPRPRERWTMAMPNFSW